MAEAKAFFEAEEKRRRELGEHYQRRYGAQSQQDYPWAPSSSRDWYHTVPQAMSDPAMSAWPAAPHRGPQPRAVPKPKVAVPPKPKAPKRGPEKVQKECLSDDEWADELPPRKCARKVLQDVKVEVVELDPSDPPKVALAEEPQAEAAEPGSDKPDKDKDQKQQDGEAGRAALAKLLELQEAHASAGSAASASTSA